VTGESALSDGPRRHTHGEEFKACIREPMRERLKVRRDTLASGGWESNTRVAGSWGKAFSRRSPRHAFVGLVGEKGLFEGRFGLK
jgi:hypothetical protein